MSDTANAEKPVFFPELAGNFEGETSAGEGCSAFLSDTGPGNFRVRLTLTAKRDADPADAFVFLGRRMLAACVPDFKGACEVSGTAHVGRFIPRGAGGAFPGRLALTLIAPSLMLTDCRIAETDVPTIHIAGDSTVTDQPAAHPYRPMENYAGWGQMLPVFFSGGFAVANHAHSGLTTETFRTEGHYDILLDELRPGDYVLFQFAHNDQKLAHLSADGGYRDNLSRYADEIRERGALPLFVTPLARNTWNDRGYNDLLKAHADAVRQLGDKKQVPVLDLHEKTTAAVKQQGASRSSILYHAGDLTHTNDCGAYLAARIIASEIRRVCGWENDYQPLAAAVENEALAAHSPAAVLFAKYRAKAEAALDKAAPASQKAPSAAGQTTGGARDIVPEDLTGPAVWQTDESGVLKNPDGSPVAPP